jgi:hypothetical protein
MKNTTCLLRWEQCRTAQVLDRSTFLRLQHHWDHLSWIFAVRHVA